MNTPDSAPTSFRTKDGTLVAGITLEQLESMWGTLTSRFGLSLTQLVEACSYSMAMVARFALGQSALEGKVVTFASDCPAGWVALAAMRHLITAGADGVVVLGCPAPAQAVSEASEVSELARQVFTLENLGIPVIELEDLLADAPDKIIESCHMALYGMFERRLEAANDAQSLACKLNSLLNEAATPVHCVESPTGIDPNSGQATTIPLYASSTLSLTCPLQGLLRAKDLVGRHYLADTSCPRDLYQQFGLDITKIFAEQPVVQIFPAEVVPHAVA